MVRWQGLRLSQNLGLSGLCAFLMCERSSVLSSSHKNSLLPPPGCICAGRRGCNCAHPHMAAAGESARADSNHFSEGTFASGAWTLERHWEEMVAV